MASDQRTEAQVVPPWWLQTVRCQGNPQCHEVRSTSKSCSESLDSHGKYRHCTEVVRHFRLCQGREPEEVATSTIVTQERLPEEPPGSSADVPGLVSSEAGQVLDEFFAFASELRDSLLNTGTLQQEADSVAVAKPRSLLGRIFGWNASNERIHNDRRVSVPSPSSQILSAYALPHQDV